MSNLTLRSAMTALGLAMVASLAAAQGAVEQHKCASVVDDAARLACYDAAFGRPAAAASPVAIPATKAREEFGLTEADKRALDPAKAAATQPESISARVASVGRRPMGELVVTLDDGQVWVQAESDTKAVVKPGDVVTIRKAALGSYVLVSANRVAMRVRRTK
jgi:hypothetical protein